MARQAVTNVLDNAIKFTRERGRITVWTRRAGSFEELVVDDEGPGIPEGQRARVLERFYRIEASGRTAAGAGLGLAIVQQAMAVNGGRVTIEESPMRGARVILALPRAAAPASA
jgi:signal transduction histidine kinase